MAGNEENEATARAEQLLGRAFFHLRHLTSQDEEGMSAFPAGLEEVEIRVEVRVSETESAAVEMRVKGREGPESEAFDYDEFEDPLLYDEDDETP